MKNMSSDTQLSFLFEDLNVSPPIQVQPLAGHPDACNGPRIPESAGTGRPRSDDIPDCDWAQFMREKGRVPLISDPRKPWEYRGWLLYYRLLCEEHPDIAPRWRYWIRTREAGRLLDEPVPKVRFEHCAPREIVKLLENWLHAIERLHHHHWSPMEVLLDWLLWGFGLIDRSPELSERLHETLYREVNIGPLLLKPYDYFGEWIANQRGKWNPHAFFPTPHTVVEFMTQMAFEAQSEGDLRTKTVMEPCLGSGRMLLHASNHSLRLYGVDIDPLLVKASLVNGALYAPWMVRSFPENFFEAARMDEKITKICVEDAIGGEALAQAGTRY
jgi:hypothetical protein